MHSSAGSWLTCGCTECRLLDQWSAIDRRGTGGRPPIVIPLDVCATFPSAYCPVPVDYGLQASDRGCTLGRWLVPGGCILPPPPPVLYPLLGRWERQSQKLAVGADAKAAMRQFLPHLEAEVKALGDAALGQERDTLAKLIAAASDDREPVTITRNGAAAAVLVDAAEWSSIQETLHLLASPANAARLRKGLREFAAGQFKPAPGAKARRAR